MKSFDSLVGIKTSQLQMPAVWTYAYLLASDPNENLITNVFEVEMWQKTPTHSYTLLHVYMVYVVCYDGAQYLVY